MSFFHQNGSQYTEDELTTLNRDTHAQKAMKEAYAEKITDTLVSRQIISNDRAERPEIITALFRNLVDDIETQNLPVSTKQAFQYALEKYQENDPEYITLLQKAFIYDALNQLERLKKYVDRLKPWPGNEKHEKIVADIKTKIKLAEMEAKNLNPNLSDFINEVNALIRKMGSIERKIAITQSARRYAKRTAYPLLKGLLGLAVLTGIGFGTNALMAANPATLSALVINILPLIAIVGVLTYTAFAVYKMSTASPSSPGRAHPRQDQIEKEENASMKENLRNVLLNKPAKLNTLEEDGLKLYSELGGLPPPPGPPPEPPPPPPPEPPATSASSTRARSATRGRSLPRGSLDPRSRELSQRSRRRSASTAILLSRGHGALSASSSRSNRKRRNTV